MIIKNLIINKREDYSKVCIFNHSFNRNKINIINAPSHSGKTLIHKLIGATLGDPNSRKSLWGQGGLNGQNSSKSKVLIYETIMQIEIKDKIFNISSTFDVRDNENENSKAYYVKYNDQEEFFSSSEPLTEFIFNIIGYPRFVTWEYNSRKTMLYDLLIPIFFEQMKHHTLYNNDSILYKKANRTALSIAFLSNKYNEDIQKIFKHNDLFEKIYKRDVPIKKTLIKLLKDRIKENDLKEGDYENIEAYQEYNDLLSEFNKKRKRLTQNSTQKIGEYKTNLMVFDVLVKNKLKENNVSELNIELIRNIFDATWFSAIDSTTPEMTKVKQELRTLRNRIEDFEKQHPDILNNHVPKKMLSDLKNDLDKIKDYDEDNNETDGLLEIWNNVYYDVRQKFDQIVRKENNSNIHKPFSSDMSNSGNNKIQQDIDILKGLNSSFNIKFFIVDSPFESDEVKTGKLKALTDIEQSGINGIFLTTTPLEYSSNRIKVITLDQNWLDIK